MQSGKVGGKGHWCLSGVIPWCRSVGHSCVLQPDLGQSGAAWNVTFLKGNLPELSNQTWTVFDMCRVETFGLKYLINKENLHDWGYLYTLFLPQWDPSVCPYFFPYLALSSPFFPPSHHTVSIPLLFFCHAAFLCCSFFLTLYYFCRKQVMQNVNISA